MYLHQYIELKNEFSFKIAVFVLPCKLYVITRFPNQYLFIVLEIWENNFLYGITCISLGICLTAFPVVLEH